MGYCLDSTNQIILTVHENSKLFLLNKLQKMKRNKGNVIKILFFSVLNLIIANKKLFGQNNAPLFSVRISLQSDFQKDAFQDVHFPFEFKEHSTTATNWGIDLLGEKEIFNNWSVYIGTGYFRNKFNFKRFYDHQLLNIGRDSFLIGTSTSNYTFHLLRFPIGISYRLLEKNKYDVNLGIENVINFSFQQVYNGGKPFPGANDKYSKLRYYGNSILLFGCISKQVSQNSRLQIELYTRPLNIYKRKDLFLFENNSTPFTRTFDGIGLSLKYSTNFKSKNHKP